MKLTKAQEDMLKKMPMAIDAYRFLGHDGTKKACMKRGLIESIKDNKGNVSKVALTKKGRAVLRTILIASGS